MKQKFFIISPAYPYRGGISDFTHRFADSLIYLGYEVEIITFSLQYPRFLFPGKTQFLEEDKTYAYPIYRKINAINPFSWISTAFYLIGQPKSNLVFAYWMSFFVPCFASINLLLRLFSRHKTIGLMHNFIPHESKFYDLFLAKFFLSRLDEIVAMNGFDYEKLKKELPCKKSINLFHPLYDHFGSLVDKSTSAEFLKLSSERNYILFFGLVRKYKGLDMLIKGFSLIAEKFPLLDLIIAGEFYEPLDSYQILIDKLNLSNRIYIFNKFLDEAEVKYYFGISDLIVQPYRSATQSGVSQVALHFLKPSLVTDVGGLGQMVAENNSGIVVKPSFESIAEGIHNFYINSSVFDWTVHLSQVKNRFSWEIFTTRFLDFTKD